MKVLQRCSEPRRPLLEVRRNNPHFLVLVLIDKVIRYLYIFFLMPKRIVCLGLDFGSGFSEKK
jgi:hypothetical protein